MAAAAVLKARDDIRQPVEAIAPTPRRRADAADWAPLSRRTLSAQLTHLPAVSEHSTSKTSHPNPTPLRSSIAFSLSRLLSPTTFAEYISSAGGFETFQDYLTAFSSPYLASLHLWRDLHQLRCLTAEASAGARGVRDVFLTPGAERDVDLENVELRAAVQGLRKIIDTRNAVDQTSQKLLERLYASEFEAFVKHRLLSHAKQHLEKRKLGADNVPGLGESFVLSNPRLHDCPIVLASPAFCTLTGYSREEIVGRNCRFLQGEATAPTDVSAIRTAIAEHKPITQLLLNYDKAGNPFFNLLCILPLFDPSGELAYFVGGQTNITGALTASSGLSLLSSRKDTFDADSISHLSLDAAESADEWLPPVDLSKFSPGVQNAGARPAPPTRTTSETSTVSGDATPPLEPASSPALPSNTEGEAAKSSKSKPSLFTSPSLSHVFKFGGNKQAHRRSSSFNGAIDNHQSPKMTRRIDEFATTYEKVCVFRAEGRAIQHVSSAFLRFCGLPASTPAEMNDSPLLGLDLLDLVKGDSTSSTTDLRKAIKRTVEEGKPASLACGVKVPVKSGSMPTATGVLHLSPMQDYTGKVIAYIAIFA
ncbi:PAS domain containing protein kinase [Rhodotorula toruloides NP11]|uniref:PAS domain containing protein kinase n=1 Tax=Rhodotorula toruloides (strain NP11) TaxID=1130832 RepID=M7XDJ3_RHOT1|nr:PAS domain containing protein kinase [Rhodotorula toruloides NP11]EMS18188.1 PAS domain containing protein kinase [Rhodotorula toruloides NP11]